MTELLLVILGALLGGLFSSWIGYARQVVLLRKGFETRTFELGRYKFEGESGWGYRELGTTTPPVRVAFQKVDRLYDHETGPNNFAAVLEALSTSLDEDGWELHNVLCPDKYTLIAVCRRLQLGAVTPREVLSQLFTRSKN